MERDYYQTPRSSKMKRFLWSAAGGDQFLLERSTYSDQIKYMCMGGTIFATAVMAALAGGYAFYTIFEPRGSAIEADFSLSVTLISMGFGCLWGLMIFNLDRFIVSSTGIGDGTEAITWQEFTGALPRLILGMIIAITISKPVEIRMFKSEIDVELHKAQMEKEREYLAQIDSIYVGRIDGENAKISKWETQITQKESDYMMVHHQVNDEMSGKNGGDRGVGPQTVILVAQRDRIGVEIDELKKRNQPLIDQSIANIKSFEAEKQGEISKGTKVASGLDGLLERIKLAHKIAGFWISAFITMLFMAIELTPIFFKLMLIKSTYDFMKENLEERIKAESGIYIQYNYHKDKKGQERDLVTYLSKEKILLEKLSIRRVQEELTEYAIERYKEEMMKKIDENPSAFIQVEENPTIAPNDGSI